MMVKISIKHTVFIIEMKRNKQTRTISRAIYDISRKADAALAEKMKKDALNLLLGTMQNHTS